MGSKVQKRDSQVPAMPDALAGYAGAGSDDLGQEDFALPFLKLIQSLSPQRDKNEPEHIDGAEEGDFFNSVTRELFPGEEGIAAVPIYFQKVYVEWVPRNQGGGFVAQHGSREDAIVNAEEGNEVVETINVYLVVQGEQGWTPVILSATSTKLTPVKKWWSRLRMTKMQNEDGEMKKAPVFAYVWNLQAVPQSNDQGRFYNVRFDNTEEFITELDNAEGVVEQVVELRELLKAGAIGADFSKDEVVAGTEPDGDDAF